MNCLRCRISSGLAHSAVPSLGRTPHIGFLKRHLAAAATDAAGKTSSRGKEEAQMIFDELKQRFGYLGAVNHKEVNSLDLFRILRAAKGPKDYKLGLQAMNLFYNFGVKLTHRETANRLLAAAMYCKVENEAVELVKLYGTWLEHPPDVALVYAVMGHFLDADQPLVVREIAQAVRSDWRMPVEPPLYILAIEAMLRLPEGGVGEALLLHEDAHVVGVRLPAPLHSRLLVESLAAFEAAWGGPGAGEPAAEEAEGEGGGERAPSAAAVGSVEEPPREALVHLQAALRAADGLARDGHLRGGASAASLCAVAWLFLRLGGLPEAARAPLLAAAAPGGAAVFLGRDWTRAARAAAENFGCHWGFSAQLPAGFFSALEASVDPRAREMLALCRRRFGRFLPAT